MNGPACIQLVRFCTRLFAEPIDLYLRVRQQSRHGMRDRNLKRAAPREVIALSIAANGNACKRILRRIGNNCLFAGFLYENYILYCILMRCFI